MSRLILSSMVGLVLAAAPSMALAHSAALEMHGDRYWTQDKAGAVHEQTKTLAPPVEPVAKETAQPLSRDQADHERTSERRPAE